MTSEEKKRDTSNIVSDLLKQFPEPPVAAPVPQGWGLTSTTGTTGTSGTSTSNHSSAPPPLTLTSTRSRPALNTEGLDMDALTLFVAFSAGQISDKQLSSLQHVLTSLDDSAFTRYTTVGFDTVCKDTKVLSRTSSSPSTPRNKGMRTRIKGIFGKSAFNVPRVRLETAVGK